MWPKLLDYDQKFIKTGPLEEVPGYIARTHARNLRRIEWQKRIMIATPFAIIALAIALSGFVVLWKMQ